jgi:tetratricopeptide (TPR) repeat protein
MYLRGREGQPLGPFPMRTIEVLFDARVIDEDTPLSSDGGSYRPLRDIGAVIARMLEVKQILQEGGDPWLDDLDAPPEPEVPVNVGFHNRSPLKNLFEAAAKKSRGFLRLNHDEGELVLSYIDGKIVAVETSIVALSLGEYLIAQGMIDDHKLQQGLERAPAMGGDLGGALISLGLIPPHTYFERFIEWAKNAVRASIGWQDGTATFEPAEIKPPPVPLGFDRFGLLIEASRALTLEDLETRLESKKGLVVIPAGVEGVSLEELKLDPKEFRVVKSIDGTKTLSALLESNVGRGELALSALRAVYYATEAGVVVFGEDTQIPREKDEARRIDEQLEASVDKNAFELLGVPPTAGDEQIRAKYKELAKLYHPDTVRPGAAQELVEARERMFDRIKSAFESIDSEEKRAQAAWALSQGIKSPQDEESLKRALIEAEVMWKKAEALVRTRKYDEALEMINGAVERKPKDTELKVYQIYYRFLASKDDREVAAQDAIKDILVTMKNEPDIASGYLFLARLNKAAGKTELSLKYFKKLLEYDAKNHEAESEIRLATMRQEKADKKKKWL